MSNKISKGSLINIKVKGREAVDKRSFSFSFYVMKKGRSRFKTPFKKCYTHPGSPCIALLSIILSFNPARRTCML